MALALYGNTIAQIVFNCFFAIGIIVSNLVLIGIILSNKELRQNSKYVIVLFLALADLFVGIFPLPMWTHTLVTQEIDLSCSTLKALYACSSITTANSCFAVIALNLEFILQSTVSSYQGMCKKMVTCILVAFFLLGPIILLVPIMVNGQYPGAPACGLLLYVQYARALVALSYWVPSFIAIILTVVSIAVHQKRRRQLNHYGQQAVSTSSTSPTAPVDMILASFLTVALFFPSEVISLTSVTCFSDCSWYYILSTVFGYFASAKSMIIPFLWFLKKDFRSIAKGQVPSNANQQPFVSQPPPYYAHQQYLEGPAALTTANQNNYFSPVVTEKDDPAEAVKQ
ncbi:melatonin receptor type 1A-like [Haliotis rufescens]|uniref:melatonin receptor type 1A-like n=1 Tax=Haliotis rufescens TaxID=6454 RepID=UPI00201F9890|nr:melatonin receptor type 1A-like [Haliotis rufescens]